MTSSQAPLMVGKPGHRWWILAVLATAQLMVALDATVVSIALPHANSIATGAAASFITAHPTIAAPSRALVAQAAVHSYTVAFWVGAAILTVAALAVASLLRRSVTEIATDGAPACVELKGAS